MIDRDFYYEPGELTDAEYEAMTRQTPSVPVATFLPSLRIPLMIPQATRPVSAPEDRERLV